MTATWLLLAASAAVIGVSKAGFGSGVGILAVPLVAWALGGEQMLGVLLPLLIIGDLFALVHYLRTFDRANLLRLLPGALAGIALGVISLEWFRALGSGERLLDGLIGGLSIAFVAGQTVLLLGRAKTLAGYRPAGWHGVALGGAAGLTSTLSHGAGPLVAMYLLPQKLDRRVFVGTTVWFFTVCNLAKLGPFVVAGLVNAETIRYVPALAPVVLVSSFAGVWLNRRISGRAFSLVIYTIVLATGARLLLRAFGI